MESHREQVRRILDYLLELAARDIEERRATIFADHSAKGILKSGATIRRFVRATEEIGAKFVSDAVEKVGVVSQDTETFAHVKAAVEDLWRSMDTILDSTVNVASGRHPHELREDSISRAAKELFAKSKNLVVRRLHLRAKLDALYFILYGIYDQADPAAGRDDIRYIYSTFPIVERQEVAAYGRYRSRELCLAYINALIAGQPDADVVG